MSDHAELALLPEGLHDDLPPGAAQEAAIIEGFVRRFEAYGYERVKPPLVEFEESLLSGPGAGLARHMFRLMDPISQRMMGVRPDITPQVARIATARLGGRPRPLRLCYSGQVLRVRGTQLRPERQFAQAGCELIGAASLEADGEVVLLATDALDRAGVRDITVDLTAPTLVTTLAAELGLDDAVARRVRVALDAKDIAALSVLPADLRLPFVGLLEAAGPAAVAIDALRRLTLPPPVAGLVDRLAAVADYVQAAAPRLRVTLDAGESRGFEYETGVSFTLFAPRVRGELGRGGRYDLDTGETATGFTLYLDSVRRALPQPKAPDRLYLPHGTPAERAAALREDGWHCVAALEPAAAAAADARRLGCSHILEDGSAVRLD